MKDTLTNNCYTTGQKLLKSSIIFGGGGVSYLAGVVAGGAIAPTGPGDVAVGATP